MRTPVVLSHALVLLLTSCTGTSPSTESTPEKDQTDSAVRDTLVIAIAKDIENLIPVVSEFSTDMDILGNLTVPMVDIEFDCSIKKIPGYATEWNWSNDGTILSMTLRDDLTWQDGKPVTVEDIAFTYELLADPEVGSANISFTEHLTEDGRPKIIDGTHIEWHFTHPYDRDTQMTHASADIVPKHIFKDADRKTLRNHPRSKSPLSFGPWKIASYEPNAQIILEPNEHFSGPESMKPHLKRVIFRILPEYSARLQELKAGRVDMMEGLTLVDMQEVQETQSNIRFERVGWRAIDYVAWNLKRAPFDDIRVRKALAMAVDVNGLIGQLLTSEKGEVYGRPATGNITPELCGVHNDDIVPLPFDPEQARSLLKEAGFKDTDGDGYLDRDGKRFEFTLTTNSGNALRLDVQNIIRAQLEAIGVKADLRQEETNAFYEHLRERDFDAALAGWAASLYIDPSSIWHSDDVQRMFNFTSYANPVVDALIEKGLKIPNPAEAATVWKEMQAQIYADQPYLFLYWQDEVVAIDERFKNTNFDMHSQFKDLHQWDVPQDKVKYKR